MKINRDKLKKNKGLNLRRQRRAHEDNLAMIFMGFILVFLVCHLPRMLLDIHELATMQHYEKCRENGFNEYPLYISISIYISHITLVLSTATNLIIYCSVSPTYRKELRKFFEEINSWLKRITTTNPEDALNN